MSTITRKPSVGKRNSQPSNEEHVNSVIFKGMASPTEATSSEEDGSEQQVKLRLPVLLLKKIDAAVKAQRIKTSRHRWLMEAIVEKLEKAS